MTPTPTTVGLWLCERVIVEASTKNISLISVFTARHVDRFPSPPVPFSVFCALTDSAGTGTMTLQVTDDAGDEIFQKRVRILIGDRLHVANWHYRVRTLSFPKSGAYQFMLSVDGDPIASRMLYVYERPV